MPFAVYLLKEVKADYSEAGEIQGVVVDVLLKDGDLYGDWRVHYGPVNAPIAITDLATHVATSYAATQPENP